MYGNEIMNQQLQARLNQIREKILSEDFLKKQGLGGDLCFWIFDYAPEDELQVREYVSFLMNDLETKNGHLDITNINLLQTLVDYLNSRNLLERVIEQHKQKGDEALLKYLKGPLHTDKFTPFMLKHNGIEDQDIVFITGVGSVWPLMRAHNILNSLHSHLGHKPVILFYPGEYNGQTLRLFNRLPTNPYYRAFRLIAQ